MDTEPNKKSPARIVNVLVGMASIFIIIWGIRSSAFILNPILLAAVITITAMPLPEKFIRRGWKGSTALIVTILTAVGILALVAFIIGYSFTNFAAQIPAYQATIAEREAAQETSQSDQLSFLSQLELTINPEQLDRLAASLVGLIGQGVFMLFMTIMIFGFLLSAAMTTPRLRGTLPIQTDSPMTRVSLLTRQVRHYISIMTGVNFLVGLGDMVFLWFLGVDFAVLWGILAWFLGYIPSVGFFFSMIPPVILAWAQYGLDKALVVVVGFILINGSIENIVKPKVMGEGLKISPVVVFVSVFFWGWVLGGLGAILAVPLTLLVLEIMDSFESTSWLVVLMRPDSEHIQEDQKAATDRVKSMWNKVSGGVRREQKIIPNGPEKTENNVDQKE